MISDKFYFYLLPSFSSDKPHYPYELPKGWEWTTIGELFMLQAGKNITAKYISPEQSESHKYPCYGGNGIRGFVDSIGESVPL